MRELASGMGCAYQLLTLILALILQWRPARFVLRHGQSLLLGKTAIHGLGTGGSLAHGKTP
jgi:hypothetical protein